MSPEKKGRPARKRGQTKKLSVAVSIGLLAVSLFALALIWHHRNPTDSANNLPTLSPTTTATKPKQTTQQSPTPFEQSPFETFIDHYLTIMQHLNSTDTKAEMASLLDANLNQTDLFSWQKTRMTFLEDPTGFYEDPKQILSSGKGICMQWSIT